MSDHGPQESHRYRSVIAAKRAFAAGENITAAIRTEEGVETNPPHAIEIAYEMQSGEYAKAAGAEGRAGGLNRAAKDRAISAAPGTR